MTNKPVYYIAAIIIGIIMYVIMSNDIDTRQEMKKNSDKSNAVYYKGQAAFQKSFEPHIGYFQEEDYVEFALCTHYVGNAARFQIFVNVYTKKYMMLLVNEDSYRIYSEGKYAVNFDTVTQVKYWTFRSTPLDYAHAFYRYNGGLRAGGTIFIKDHEDKAPSELIRAYFNRDENSRSKNFSETRGIDKKLSGIENFDTYTAMDTFCEKWFFIEEKKEEDAFRDLRRDVAFSKNFGYFERGSTPF